MSEDVLGYLHRKGIQTKRASADEVHIACMFCGEDDRPKLSKLRPNRSWSVWATASGAKAFSTRNFQALDAMRTAANKGGNAGREASAMLPTLRQWRENIAAHRDSFASGFRDGVHYALRTGGAPSIVHHH